jgi:hypothetical protein
MDIDNITEKDAMKIVADMAYKFRWNYCLMSETDIAATWQDITDSEITDEQLHAVRSSYYWRNMDDYMAEDASNGLHDAIWEVRNGCNE